MDFLAGIEKWFCCLCYDLSPKKTRLTLNTSIKTKNTNLTAVFRPVTNYFQQLTFWLIQLK